MIDNVKNYNELIKYLNPKNNTMTVMKNYFIDDQRVPTSNLRHSPMKIDGIKGFVIVQDDLQKFCDKYSLKVQREFPTEYDGLARVDLIPADSTEAVAAPAEPEKPQYRVIFGDFNGRAREKFSQIAQVFADDIGQNVVIDVPHRRTRDYRPNHFGADAIVISIWSCPRNSFIDSYSTVPPRVFGTVASNRDQPMAVKPLFGDHIIMDGNYQAMLIRDNVVYILHDLVETGSEAEFELFGKYLMKAKEWLTASKESRETMMNDEMKKIKMQRAKEFASLLNGRIVRQTQTFEREIAELKTSMTSYTKRLMEAERTKEIKTIQLIKMKESVDENNGKFIGEYERLFKIPELVNVEIQENKLMLFTSPIAVLDNRSKLKHDLGEFRIELNFTDGNVKWFNLTRQVNGHQSRQNAPHVWNDGRACLGNTEQMFNELMRDYQIHAAAQMAVAFVKEVNVDDTAGDKVTRWPIAQCEHNQKVLGDDYPY